MNTFESMNTIKVYELDEQERKDTFLFIREHRNRHFVVIEAGGVRYTVFLSDVKRAIENAQNTHE